MRHAAEQSMETQSTHMHKNWVNYFSIWAAAFFILPVNNIIYWIQGIGMAVGDILGRNGIKQLHLLLPLPAMQQSVAVNKTRQDKRFWIWLFHAICEWFIGLVLRKGVFYCRIFIRESGIRSRPFFRKIIIEIICTYVIYMLTQN